MRKGKRFLALVLSAMLTLSVASCGNKAENNSSTKGNQGTTASQSNEGSTTASVERNTDPVTVMASVQENLNVITNVEAKMVMDMDMSLSAPDQVQEMKGTTTMDMVCFSDPLKIKMDMTIDMGELGSMAQMIYGEATEDGNCMMYLYDGEDWYSEEVGIADMKDYNACDNVISVINEDATYTLEGTEQVDGVNAIKYSNVIKGDDMKELLTSSGALDSISTLVDPSQIDSMLEGLGEMTEYVWIDEELMYPIKYEADMTEIINDLMVSMLEALGDQAEGLSINFPKMKMSMTFSNFNNATDFTIPEEAKAN